MKPSMYLVGLLVGITVSNFAGAVTFEKTFVTARAGDLEKGISFPVLGLDSKEPKFVSARLYKWTQSKLEQVELHPTNDYTVFPQLMRVTEGSRKVIRIKGAPKSKLSGQSFYRIVLEEYDRPDGTDSPVIADASSGMTVRVKPIVTIPMVVTSNEQNVVNVTADGVQARLSYQKDKAGKVVGVLNIHNRTQNLVIVRKLRQDTSGIEHPMLAYAQPGHEVDAEISASKITLGTKVSMVVEILQNDATRQELQIPVEQTE